MTELKGRFAESLEQNEIDFGIPQEILSAFVEGLEAGMHPRDLFTEDLLQLVIAPSQFYSIFSKETDVWERIGKALVAERLLEMFYEITDQDTLLDPKKRGRPREDYVENQKQLTTILISTFQSFLRILARVQENESYGHPVGFIAFQNYDPTLLSIEFSDLSEIGRFREMITQFFHNDNSFKNKFTVALLREANRRNPRNPQLIWLDEKLQFSDGDGKQMEKNMSSRGSGSTAGARGIFEHLFDPDAHLQ